MTLARGDIISFLEADCIARPDWIRKRVAAHRAGHEAVASAVAVAANPLCGSSGDDVPLLRKPVGGVATGRGRAPALHGLSFTRDVLNRAGPFDEDRRIEEDSLMGRRLHELGVSVWFEPSVCIEHIGPTSLITLLKEQASLVRRQARHDILNHAAGFVQIQGGIQVRIPGVRGGWEDGPTRLRAIPLPEPEPEAMRSRSSGHRQDPPVDTPRFVENTLGWGQEQFAYAFNGAFTELGWRRALSSPTTTSPHDDG